MNGMNAKCYRAAVAEGQLSDRRGREGNVREARQLVLESLKAKDVSFRCVHHAAQILASYPAIASTTH